MKIDIEPIIEKASELDKIALHYRDEDAFYLFRTFEGKDYSVKFTRTALNEFQPSKTVSEVMKSWESNIDRRIKELKKALKTNKHPHFKEMVEDKTRWDFRNEKIEYKMKEGDNYRDLTHSEIENFTLSLEKLKKDEGKITFIKLV